MINEKKLLFKLFLIIFLSKNNKKIFIKIIMYPKIQSFFKFQSFVKGFVNPSCLSRKILL